MPLSVIGMLKLLSIGSEDSVMLYGGMILAVIDNICGVGSDSSSLLSGEMIL